MDRNEILANFQACTGIDDIGQCIAHLEQTDWNLNEAVSVAIAANASTPSSPVYNPVPEEFSESTPVFRDFLSGSDSASNKNKERMINFLIHLNKTTKHISLDETATLGVLRDLAVVELGIPKKEARFSGWPQLGTDIMPDETTLSMLELPSSVSLTVHSATNGATSAPNFSAFGLMNNITIGDENMDFPLPCAAFKDDIEELRKIYILEITDKRTKKIHNVTFNGTKTFEELKIDVYSLTEITPNKQVWNDLTSNYNGTITLGHTMASLKLNTPIHKCSVTSQTDPGQSSSSSFPIDLTVDDDNMEVDDYEDASENTFDDLVFSNDVPKLHTLRALMPDEATDDVAALAQFQSEFNSRYGDDTQITPSFIIDSLDAAIQEAFGGAARNRKILAVYLHHDKSIQSNIFCSQLLCAPSVVEYMANHCVIWAWDITTDFNRKRMLDMCSRTLGSGVSDTLKRIPQNSFPMLVLAQGRGRSCEVNSIIQGNTSLDELMVKLIKAVEDAEMQKQEDVRQEEMSEARELIKREQEQAYQESLKQDMEKQKKIDDEKAQLEQEQREAEQIEREKNKKIEQLGEIVPAEPSADCGQPIARIRFRPPCGEDMITRKFLASEPLQGLLNYVGSLGYLSEKYRVITSYPKRDISSLDPRKTLESHKLFPQETLIIEERIE